MAGDTVQFLSHIFIISLPLILIINYLLPVRFRKWFLLLASVVLYSIQSIYSCVFILLFSLVAYAFSHILVKNTRKKPMLTLGIVLCVIPIVLARFTIIHAPVGLSFFSLQAISLLVDSYYGKIIPPGNPLMVVLYLAFFPTVVSGPILRPYMFFEQIDMKQQFDLNIFERNVVYFVWGMLLKLLIADRLGIIVDGIYNDCVHRGGLELLIAILGYSIQIYADFAGYSSMAIGIAGMCGIETPDNFVAPYLSQSISEFWSRWHISLSSWLRDYIYIPLGGNRKGQFRRGLNLIITFLASAFWHGNTLGFVIWGLLHALFQLIEDQTKKCIIGRIPLLKSKCKTVSAVIKRTLTFSSVSFAWIFFRLGLSKTIFLLRTMAQNEFIRNQTLFDGIGIKKSDIILLIICIGVVVVFDVLFYIKKTRVDRIIISMPRIARCFCVIIMILLVMIYGTYGVGFNVDSFIYANF